MVSDLLRAIARINYRVQEGKFGAIVSLCHSRAVRTTWSEWQLGGLRNSGCLRSTVEFIFTY